jgi:hypothetical protein
LAQTAGKCVLQFAMSHVTLATTQLDDWAEIGIVCHGVHKGYDPLAVRYWYASIRLDTPSQNGGELQQTV